MFCEREPNELLSRLVIELDPRFGDNELLGKSCGLTFAAVQWLRR